MIELCGEYLYVYDFNMSRMGFTVNLHLIVA